MNRSQYHSGDLAFAIILVLLSCFLMLSIPEETKWFNGLALLKQPRFWPSMAIVGLSFFALAYATAVWRRVRREQASIRDEVEELIAWARPLEYVAYFLAYVFMVPVMGYLFATLTYFVLMTFRAGYRSKQMYAIAVLVALVVVVLFKSILQVKIGPGMWYEMLPSDWANFFIVYL
ncbi:MAG: tripartite tricarboxylate transporter TctB family protein [Gammaproteobacteria bacterium]|nr:tripartite tricarboxylate transporter TctB family protein [Gammaproteobacteria bacterium]MCP4881538.1 tripartite tricarboxylate transporter TctB family protein [Gammaproteobacteria bacterium]MDP6166954.1 tripartite tricarboxylate transporter TctB family protein [Gammaproteobacteria bacterium]